MWVPAAISWARNTPGRPYNEWEEKGDNADDWALETAREILSAHKPDELDPKVSEEMDRIILSLEK